MELDLLLLSIEEKSAEEIEEIGRRHYFTEILTQGRLGIHSSHDGEQVFFWENRFEHAFFESDGRANWGISKARASGARISRMPWIVPILSGQVPGSECWQIHQRGRGFPPSRLYVHWPKNYLIWLEPRAEGGFKFSTAYLTAANQIRERYCRKGAKIWPYGQK